MDQRRHDAAHVHLVATAVPLTVVLHPQPGRWERVGVGVRGEGGVVDRWRKMRKMQNVSPDERWNSSQVRGCVAPAGDEDTHTWPVSCATTKAEEKPSSWFRVQLRTWWHMPVTGA